MSPSRPDLEERLARHGVSRRQFLRFCGLMSATLALSELTPQRIESALAAAPRLPLIWLEFQDCTGDSESFLRSSNPTVAAILLELCSLNYHETLMVPAGQFAEKSRSDTLAQYPGQYITIVEGSIPTAQGGIYCTVGGRTALDIAREICPGGLATITVGTCAAAGGWPKATPNPTGAVGVSTAVPNAARLINLPGCPMNVVNLTAVIVQYLTDRTWPALDSQKRPTFAYGRAVHDTCPRKGSSPAKAFGDALHRAGNCLKGLGCNGPTTHANCNQALWNDKTSWCVAAGHPCIGCTETDFWDHFEPFYTNFA